MATSSSSGTGGGSGGTVAQLDQNLIGPEAIVVDTQFVYFTTSSPGGGAANYVATIDTTTDAVGMPELSNFQAAPALALGGTGSGAYLGETNLGGMGELYLLGSGAPQSLESPMSPILGVAAYAAEVYFTTSDGNVWHYVAPGPATPFPTGNWSAAGAIAADIHGVYWATTSDLMMRAPLGTPSTPQELCTLTAAKVNAITTDGTTDIYWTNDAGVVMRAPNGATGTLPVSAKSLVSADADNDAAYGIATDGSSLYFARGDGIYRVDLMSTSMSTEHVGLAHPHGIALDQNHTVLYVAEHGSPPQNDGAIVAFKVQ
jgi:hypothetical protein